MAATDKSSTPDHDREPSARGLVRHLAGRYLFVLVAVAALVIVDQAIVQPLLVGLNAYAPVINLSGRQRMLSQKLTKAALALRAAEEEAKRNLRRDELRETLGQWSVAQAALRRGNAELGIEKIQSAEINRQWELLQPHFEAMCAAARRIVDLPDVYENDPPLVAAVDEIVEHEAGFLPVMDQIVKLMEQEAARAVSRLRAAALGISGAVVVLLVGLGWFVVRPATRTIRRQVDELETRVALRTSELSAALEVLQREVYQRQQAESRNQRLAAQLAHAERVSTMGHLAVGLAHELNQPLSAISNYSEACDVLLKDDSGGGQVRGHLKQVRNAALRAGHIVRRIRNFVRPNPGTASRTDVEINALVREIADLCRVEAEHADATIRLDLAGQDAVVSGDPVQLQQVLVNLVQNALQAMKDCPPDHCDLDIRTSIDGGLVRIEVLDSGPGFASDDPEKLFAPFHTTKSDGLGIGLAICRSIVEDHQGTIWAESRAEGGAKVSFTLPLATPHGPSRRELPDCVCR